VSTESTVVEKILATLQASKKDLGVSEMAKLSGVSRVSVHYAVKTLVELNKIRVTRKVGHIPLYELVKEE
jgi:DNA-binding transcriptional regulator GbsR (MarR family)